MWKVNYLSYLAICTIITLIGVSSLLVQPQDADLNFCSWKIGYLEGSDEEGDELYI